MRNCSTFDVDQRGGAAAKIYNRAGMRPIRVGLSLWVSINALMLSANAFACGGIFDVGCNITHGGMSPGNIVNQTQTAAQDATNVVTQTTNQLGPVGPIIAAPLAPISTCLTDLKNCPRNTVTSIPEYQVITACANNIQRCPQYIIASAPTQTVGPIVYSYKQSLLSQASGKWRSLPDTFISAFASDYPEIDLHDIRYATGINTIHGNAITFANTVFFPSALDLNTQAGRRLMLHELQHSVQYALRGGEPQFLSEYMLRAAGKIIACQCVNVHDAISLEADAIAKSESVFDEYGWTIRVKNSCNNPIRVAVSVKDSDGNWPIKAWYRFIPNESNYLSSAGQLIHSNNRIFYFYAYDLTTGSEWRGSDPDAVWAVDDKDRMFNKKEISEAAERFDLNFVCN